MTRAPRSLSARLALFACGCTAFLVTRAEAKQVAPFRTALAVRWGVGAGSDAFRDDLARTLAENLAGRCFAGVTIDDRDPSPGDAELVLSVILSGVVDETRFDDSIAATLQPGEPAKELRHVAHYEVTVDATLATRATGALVGRKHLVSSAAHRPLYLGEDAQATARLEVIDNIVDDVARGLGCGGAKLERKIRDALGAAGEASPAPR
jgi:hypothetical protein